jgi:hypothetical protein
VDGDDGPQADIAVVAEDDLFVPGFLAGIEEFHGVASLVFFFRICRPRRPVCGAGRRAGDFQVLILNAARPAPL